MATPLRVTNTYVKATGALLKNLPVALAAALGMALISAPIDQVIYSSLSSGPAGHAITIQVMLAWFGIYLLAAIIIGPLFTATAVFVAKKHWDGKSAGLYGAFNFALNRYKRMFLPHAGATLSIQFGLQVLIPGILFMCMYAFVDSVACLEDEKWPMARSKALTRNRRKSILWVALPIIMLSIPKGLIIDPAAMEIGLPALIGSHAVSYLMEWWLALAFAWMYLTRVSAVRAAADGAIQADESAPAK
jgi:hypothetical protein